MHRFSITFLTDQFPALDPPLIHHAHLLALGPDQAIRHARRRWPDAYAFEITAVQTNWEQHYARDYPD